MTAKLSVVHNHLNIARKSRLGALKQMVDTYERTAEAALDLPVSRVDNDTVAEHQVIRDIYKAVFNEKLAQRNYEEFREETAELIDSLTGKCEEYLVNGTCIHSEHTP